MVKYLEISIGQMQFKRVSLVEFVSIEIQNGNVTFCSENIFNF